MAETIEALVDGGKATPGPPIGPALGPLGVNVVEIVGVINEKTKAFAGMKVPVKLVIDPKTKEYEVTVGTPPTSALIIKELGIDGGSGEPNTNYVGDMTLEQAIKVSEMKKDSLLGANTKERVMEVSGTCVAMGVKIDGKDPKEFQSALKRGKYDKQFAAAD